MSADWTGSIVSTFSWELPKRWRVRFDPCPTFEGMEYWAVYAPSGLLAIERFRTWREALDYADRMARTREVVLPRQPLPLSLPGDEGDKPITVTQDEWGFVFLTDEGDGEMVVLSPHELRPLAGTLFALAEQEEQA